MANKQVAIIPTITRIVKIIFYLQIKATKFTFCKKNLKNNSLNSKKDTYVMICVFFTF